MRDSSVLVVEFSHGDPLRFGPAPRPLLEVRAQELWEAGAKRARYLLDGELLTFAEDITEAAAPEPSTSVQAPRAAIPEPARAREEAAPEARAITLERAAELALEMIKSTTAQCERMLQQTQENAIAQARAADEILAKSQRRTLEHDAALAQIQAAQTENTLKQSARLQEFISGMNATIAEERVALFKIRASEQEIADRQATIEEARQRAMLAASRPSAAQLATDFIAAFAVRYAENASTNYAVMNGEPVTTGIVDQGASHEPRRN